MSIQASGADINAVQNALRAGSFSTITFADPMKINKAAMKAAAEDAVKGLRESILQRITELEGATLTIGAHNGAPTTHDTTGLANDVLALK
jgi:hypothetical protein